MSTFAQAASDTGAIGGGTAIAGLGSRGVTPWDLPEALAEFKGTIWKKTKFEIGYGQSFTYQIRDPKNRVITKNVLDKLTGGNKPGWTRYLLILSKPIAGYDQSVEYGEAVNAYCATAIGATRKYTYKFDQSEARQDAYANS